MQAKLHASERLLQDLIGSQLERNTTYEDLIKVKLFKAACMQLLGSVDGSQLIDPKSFHGPSVLQPTVWLNILHWVTAHQPYLTCCWAGI